MSYGTSFKVERLLAIILLLYGGKRRSAPELAEMFEVSVRTIYRDIESLIGAGVPVLTTSGAQGGIELEKRYHLESSLLSGKDLAAMVVGLAGAGSSGCIPGVDRVIKKVEQLVPGKEQSAFRKAADSIFVDLSPWNDSASRKERILLLEEAISDCCVLQVDYLDSSDRQTRRDIEPHTLVLKGVSWYLYSFCRLREDFRIFRVSRIKGLQLTGERFIRRNVDAACLPWNEAWSSAQDGMRVSLLLDEQGFSKAIECFPEEMITPRGDGYYTLEADLPNHEWVPQFLLSFGEHVEVLSPDSLRDRILTLTSAIASKYISKQKKGEQLVG